MMKGNGTSTCMLAVMLLQGTLYIRYSLQNSFTYDTQSADVDFTCSWVEITLRRWCCNRSNKTKEKFILRPIERVILLILIEWSITISYSLQHSAQTIRLTNIKYLLLTASKNIRISTVHDTQYGAIVKLSAGSS